MVKTDALESQESRNPLRTADAAGRSRDIRQPGDRTRHAQRRHPASGRPDSRYDGGERPQPDTLHPAAQDTDPKAVIRSTYRSRSASAPSAHRGSWRSTYPAAPQGRTRRYDRIAEPTARMEGTGVQPDSLPAGGVSGALYDLCDRYGFYVVEQAPINTSRSGMSRRKGGNPSNDPHGRRPISPVSRRATTSLETASVRRSILARRRFRQRSQPLDEGYSTSRPLKRSARFSTPMPAERNSDNPAVGRTIRAIRQRIKRDCVKTPLEKSTPVTTICSRDKSSYFAL